MDYAALKLADAALGIADPGQAAAALNVQTVTVTNQPFTWADAKRVARTSSTLDWSRIVARARLVPTLPPTSAADVAILASINAIEMDDGHVIDPADAAGWQTWQAGLAALHASGDLSDATVTALNNLTNAVKRSWVGVDAGHIQTARLQP